MERFLHRHKDRVAGSISGFDRMRFTGTLRWMAHVEGMGKFLNSQGVLLKDFGTYVERLSEQIKKHGYGIAEAKGRPVQVCSLIIRIEGRHRAGNRPAGRHPARINLRSELRGAMPIVWD